MVLWLVIRINYPLNCLWIPRASDLMANTLPLSRRSLAWPWSNVLHLLTTRPPPRDSRILRASQFWFATLRSHMISISISNSTASNLLAINSWPNIDSGFCTHQQYIHCKWCPSFATSPLVLTVAWFCLLFQLQHRSLTLYLEIRSRTCYYYVPKHHKTKWPPR